MHQISLRMARIINMMQLKEVAEKTGVAYNELEAAEQDSRTLKYETAFKLVSLYRLPSLSVIYLGKEKDFRWANHSSGLDLLETYIDFIKANRKRASSIMVWFELVEAELEPGEQTLIRRTLEDFVNSGRSDLRELRRTVDYIQAVR
ncbi:hypothetical protein QWJ34_03565 [Saccharibacillus sp. CPCC 101409]|uniref:hypothetical protein n=1 Tax=Saccharibacillus sp. CPCC 101409 TaxID=3058041 RepID=UPI002672CE84|nr:hypothetical protein [Saccharibacillus sp. CPCC 101409]MDO3408836.1 hypothetical protein [Saccharibacillus sp. CPCC 101409]